MNPCGLDDDCNRAAIRGRVIWRIDVRKAQVAVRRNLPNLWGCSLEGGRTPHLVRIVEKIGGSRTSLVSELCTLLQPYVAQRFKPGATWTDHLHRNRLRED
ncbi:hypothetical protein D3C87_1355380 [compost metagenome]